jgi:hypothetical protein
MITSTFYLSVDLNLLGLNNSFHVFVFVFCNLPLVFGLDKHFLNFLINNITNPFSIFIMMHKHVCNLYL